MPTMVLKLTILGDDDVEIQEHYASSVFDEWQKFVEVVREKYGDKIVEQLLSIPLRHIGVFEINGIKVFVFNSDSPTNGFRQYTEVICTDLIAHEQRSKLEFEEFTIKHVHKYTWRYCYKYTCRHT